MKLKRVNMSLFFFLVSGFLQITNISSMFVFMDKHKSQSFLVRKTPMYRRTMEQGITSQKVINQDIYKVIVPSIVSENSKELMALKRYLRSNPFVPIPLFLLLGLLPIIFLKLVISVLIGNILLLKLHLKKKEIYLDLTTSTTVSTITTEPPIIIRLYDHMDFFEDEHVLQVTLTKLVCMDIQENLLELSDGVTGIKTNGHCVILFDAFGCTGNQLRIESDTSDLEPLNFDNMARSLRTC